VPALLQPESHEPARERYPVQRQRSRVYLAELHVSGAVPKVGAVPELGLDDPLAA